MPPTQPTMGIAGHDQHPLISDVAGLELQELYAAKYGAANSGSLKPDPTYTPLAAPGGAAATA